MNKRWTAREKQWSEAFTSPRQEGPRSDCVDPQDIWRAACNRLERSAMNQILNHVLDCSHCAHDLHSAREMAQELGEIEEPIGGEEPSPVTSLPSVRKVLSRFSDKQLRWARDLIRGAPWVQIPLRVVTPIVALSTMLVTLQILREPEGLWRTAEQLRGGNVDIELMVDDGSALNREAFSLSWEGPPGAIYALVVHTEELCEVFAAQDIEALSFTLPHESLGDLQDGVMLYWRVEGYLEDGGRVDSSTYSVVLGQEEKRGLENE